MSLRYPARRDQRGRNPYGNNLPIVPFHHSSYDVIHALRSPARANSAYIFAVLKNYCDLKLARGKTSREIEQKLTVLEHEMRWRSPMYERGFDEIREYYLLRPSPLAGGNQQAAFAQDPLRRASTLNPALSRPATRPQSEIAASRPAVTRASDDPSDEPPPPPYSASDPEPEATAVLMAVQQAESSSSARPASITSQTPSINTNHRRTQSDVGSTLSSSYGDAPRPNAFPASPAQRAGSLAVPNGNGLSPDLSGNPPPPDRPTTPLNEEEERIREESELEEAMRLSRLSEKERLEYERAVQASLATLEEDSSLRRIAEEQFPGETAAGPSSRPDDARRASSYQPGASSSQPMGMQRASSAQHAPPGDMFASTSSGYQQPAAGPSTSGGYVPPQNLLDALESLDFSGAPPLTPAKPTTPSAIAPHRTGMQSNNPFLSDVERGVLVEDSSPSVSDHEPESYTRESHQHRELPPLPTEAEQHPQYDPPDHPPPGWVPDSQQQYSAPTEPPPVPPLPQRMNTQPEPPQHPPPLPPHPTAQHRLPPPIATSGFTGHLGSTYMSPAILTPETPLPAHAPSPAPFLIGGEDALEMLREYDTVFLIDDSTSMKGERWEQAKTAIMGVVVQAVKYDEDGVDVYFLNSKRVGKGLRTTDDVEELFAGLEPKGATPTGLRMEAILREYMARLERATADGESVRAMNLIVVTDGAFAVPVVHRVRRATSLDDRLEMLESAPTDDPESVLISIARRLDRGDYPLSQVGVQLLQIGDDQEAKEALQELDEGISAAHGVRDMVDTVPYNGEAMSANLIVKVLLGGINRRIDRKFKNL